MVNNKVLFVLLTIVFICISGITAYSLKDTNDYKDNDAAKWIIPTNNSIFQFTKVGVFPWFIVLLFTVLFKFKTGKFGALNFLRNNFSSLVGLFSYIITVIAAHYIWVIGIGRGQEDVYNIPVFVVCVIIGVFIWYITAGLTLSTRLDHRLTIILSLLTIAWYGTCSYNQCPNIY